ncbi:MAG: TIGR01244 family sulfur transferase [Sphingobium sp.]|nr:TIGR01244 family sulfur transferase [Sphingobium sp.]
MFRQLTDTLYVSPQISVKDVARAKELGVTVIVNNRPDDEEPGQVNGAEIEASAKAAGLAYVAVPVAHGGFAPWQLDGMAAALEQAGEGGVLAYCRSGTRSTLLWALTRARAGDNADMLSAKAGAAGYDLSPVRQIMDALAAGTT